MPAASSPSPAASRAARPRLSQYRCCWNAYVGSSTRRPRGPGQDRRPVHRDPAHALGHGGHSDAGLVPGGPPQHRA